jgi:hypothetical protein
MSQLCRSAQYGAQRPEAQPTGARVRTPLRRTGRLDRICKWTVETGSGTEPLHGRVAADKWVIRGRRMKISAPLVFRQLAFGRR